MADEGTVDAPLDYPWYRPVTDQSLEQGDIFFDFPTVSVVSSYDEILDDTIEFETLYYNVIVLTQSCDLVAGKIENVVLCPFFTKQNLAPKFKDLGKSNGEEQVQKGRWESLYLLPPCTVGGHRLEPRIVNFRQALAVPLGLITEHAKRETQRVRLCPPYREHLAQAFARFIMRIGFPIDFRV